MRLRVDFKTACAQCACAPGGSCATPGPRPHAHAPQGKTRAGCRAGCRPGTGPGTPAVTCAGRKTRPRMIHCGTPPLPSNSVHALEVVVNPCINQCTRCTTVRGSACACCFMHGTHSQYGPQFIIELLDNYVACMYMYVRICM